MVKIRAIKQRSARKTGAASRAVAAAIAFDYLFSLWKQRR
jgi:hypothetical protein